MWADFVKLTRKLSDPTTVFLSNLVERDGNPMYLNRDGLKKFVGQGTVGLVKLPATLTHLFLAVADDDQATTLLPLLHSLKRLKLIREYPPLVQ